MKLFFQTHIQRERLQQLKYPNFIPVQDLKDAIDIVEVLTPYAGGQGAIDFWVEDEEAKYFLNEEETGFILT